MMEEPTRRNRWERLQDLSKDWYVFMCFLFPTASELLQFLNFSACLSRVMQKANGAMHGKMKTAQKGLQKVLSFVTLMFLPTRPNPFTPIPYASGQTTNGRVRCACGETTRGSNITN